MNPDGWGVLPMLVLLGVTSFCTSGCRETQDPNSGLARIDPHIAEKWTHEILLEDYLRSGDCSITLSREEHLEQLEKRYGESPPSDLEQLWSVTVVPNQSVEFVGVPGSPVDSICKGRAMLEGFYER